MLNCYEAENEAKPFEYLSTKKLYISVEDT
jgi:hypothetical protein